MWPKWGNGCVPGGGGSGTAAFIPRGVSKDQGGVTVSTISSRSRGGVTGKVHIVQEQRMEGGGTGGTHSCYD